MIVKHIPRSWIAGEEHRLDCGPFTRGGIEAKKHLDACRYRKESLVRLTLGGASGMYHVGMDKLRWAPAHLGVRFLRSSDILKVDFARQPYLMADQVAANPLFRCPAGTTLITRSGTIGRMAYCREDMSEMAMSQDVLKVVPDPDRIPAGFLYAFLSSKFGLPLVVNGTFGSIIVHIEAENIANLPVPRIGNGGEAAAHELVERASARRTTASNLLKAAINELEALAGLSPLSAASSPTPHSCSRVKVSELRGRLDAFFHSGYRRGVVSAIEAASCPPSTVSELATSIVEPTRLKRVKIDQAAHGVPFFGTSALSYSDPEPLYLIPKRQAGVDQYMVHQQTLLVPRSGQLSGIIGNIVFPHGDILGAAVSEDAIRVNCGDENQAGYLYLALSSEYGVRQLKARAYGSSIPHLDVANIGQVLVPDLGPVERVRLGSIGARVRRLRDEALSLEREARTLVERSIEAAT